MPIERSEQAFEVLSDKQMQLAPLLEEFSSTHILVGGTAIALHLAHRKSIDFDLFTFGPQGTGKEIMQRIQKTGLKLDHERSSLFRLSDEEQPELTLFIEEVKVQLLDFSRNPFGVQITLPSNCLLDGIPSLDLLTLGAMKLYAMMYRKKWKDMVDVFFILHTSISFQDLVIKAKELFQELRRVQYTLESILSNEWDMSEEVDRLIDYPPDSETIQSYMCMEVDAYLDASIMNA